MDRFVKGFKENCQSDLECSINNYATENNLKILQISYSVEAYTGPLNKFYHLDKALVLFEKLNL